jgi:hypothetical protein
LFSSENRVVVEMMVEVEKSSALDYEVVLEERE